MAVTVQDLLDLDVMTRARPEVVHGHDLDRRAVRWVHTSEIYDIAPLLKGGEVLLTTGLGLIAAGPAALADYATALAGRGIAALLLEVGRTFPEVPPALAAAARRVDLPLVALHGVVPFIEVTEAVHPLLIADEIDLLRAGEHATSVLTAQLLDGAGLAGVTSAAAGLAGCQVRLVTAEGGLVATHDGTAAPAASADLADTPEVAAAGIQECRHDVLLGGETWGTVVLDAAPNPLRAVVAERTATAVALEVQRSGTTVPARRAARARLLRDLVDGRYASTAEITSRATGLGLVVGGRRQALAVCLATSPGTPTRTAVAAVAEAARRVFGPSLVADFDEDLVVATATDTTDLRRTLTRFADEVDDEVGATTGGRVRAVTASRPVPDLAGLVGAVTTARSASALARSMSPTARVLLDSDLGMHRLLARSVRDDDLERFVQDQLGTLLAHDAAHGGDLVRTLDTYLASGLSKAQAAQSLGIRRQSLYGRLDRIAALLGGLDLGDRERRTALDLALVAWRLRSAGVGRSVAGREHVPAGRSTGRGHLAVTQPH